MTFKGFEASVEGSRPIELYRFEQGASTFFYTSSEDQQTINLIDYVPEVIVRGRLSQGPEDRSNVVELTLPATNPFVKQYISVVPGSRALLTITRVQRSDFPSPEVITLFEGFVQSVAFTEDVQVAKIAALPISTATSRAIPRFTFQGLCNNVLYDGSCKVSNTDSAFRLVGDVLTASGSDITVQGADGFPDGFFTAGFVEANGGADGRLILAHVGTTLSLLLPFPQSLVGDSVVVLAGCDHTIEVCDTKFFTPEDTASNVINFAGFKFVPTKNIFVTGLD